MFHDVDKNNPLKLLHKICVEAECVSSLQWKVVRSPYTVIHLSLLHTVQVRFVGQKVVVQTKDQELI